MKALLLAAGIGSRLRPLTEGVPKCLVPINGTPLLAYWLRLLDAAGVDEIVINTHHLAERVGDFVDASPWRNRITLFHEPELLGTAGTLRALAPRFRDDTLVLAHADNLVDFDWPAFVRRHAERPPAVVLTLMSFETDQPQACGILEEDAAGIVTAFHEKVPNPPGRRANGAVYLIEPEFVRYVETLPADARDLSIDVLPHFVGRMQTWFDPNAYLRDIGTLASLARAEAEFAARRPGA